MPVTLNGKETVQAVVLDFDGTFYQAGTELDEMIWGELRKTIALHALQDKGIASPTQEEINREVEAYCKRAKVVGWTQASLETGLAEEEYLKIVADVNKAKHLEFDAKLAAALEVLLNELPVYIFTGSTHQSVLDALKVLIGDLWRKFEKHLLAMDDLENGQKPSKEAYEEIVRKFKLNPEKTVLVDDQLSELKTAAGLGFITFLIGDQDQTIEPHLVLDSVAQLLDYLDLG